MGIREITGAQDSLLVTQRFVKRLTKHDAHIFDGVVLVDFKVTTSLEVQIESSVMSKQFEHVVEEIDSSRDLVLSMTVDVQDRRISVSLVGR